jgi:hypothetical protein
MIPHLRGKQGTHFTDALQTRMLVNTELFDVKGLMKKLHGVPDFTVSQFHPICYTVSEEYRNIEYP